MQQHLTDGQNQPIYALEGVRALACLGVLSFHVSLWAYLDHLWTPWPGDLGAILSSLPFVGETGFLLFFVLSGFLLFLPYARSILFDQAWPSTRRYYLRRIFRILPAYYVALFFMLVFLSPEYLKPDHSQQLWLFLTLRMDLPLTYQQINPPFWTLAVEFQFYLLLPLFAALMRLISNKGPLYQRLLLLTNCILILLIWGLLTRYWGFMPTQTQTMTMSLPPALWSAILTAIFGYTGKYLEVFALGMLLAVVYVYLHETPASARRTLNLRRLSPFFLGLGLLLFLTFHIWHHHAVWVRVHFLDPYNDFLLPYKDIFTPLGYALGLTLCLFAIVLGPARFRRPLESKFMRRIASFSYSLYLWHFPLVIYFSQTIVPKFQALGWNPLVQYALFGLWTLLTAIPLANFLALWVEIPGMFLGGLCYNRLESAIKTLGIRYKAPKRLTLPRSLIPDS